MTVKTGAMSSAEVLNIQRRYTVRARSLIGTEIFKKFLHSFLTYLDIRNASDVTIQTWRIMNVIRKSVREGKQKSDVKQLGLLTFLWDDFKTQPPVDRWFRSVLAGFHCLEQYKPAGTGTAGQRAVGY